MMKRLLLYLGLLVFTILVVFMVFSGKNTLPPETLYKVYFEGEVLGYVESDDALYEYIDSKNIEVKEKYGVDVVKSPEELKLEQISVYNIEPSTTEEMYNTVSNKGVFSVPGYEFKLKEQDSEKIIYVTDKNVFEKAVEEVIATFVGAEEYEAYKNGTQENVDEIGSEIRDVYISETVTVRALDIPVSNDIYNDAEVLTKYLLFGTTELNDTYTVKSGDTISSVAFDNEIGVGEFLISNPEFKSESNLLFPGQEVTIGLTNPQIHVYAEVYSITENESTYRIEEQVDNNMVVGDHKIIRAGEKGLEKLTRVSTSLNGMVVNIDPLSKLEIKPSISQIVVRGGKKVSNVGNQYIWGWPTTSGWVISSGYGYRIHPITGVRGLHDALDIAGTGTGSPIYAANHGTVIMSSYNSLGGYMIIIDHNNGYFTTYQHNSKLLVTVGQTVYRGMKIALMGSTGRSTGPHLHFSVYKGHPYQGGYSINPWTLY